MIGRYASRFAVYNNRLDGVERTPDNTGLLLGSSFNTNDTATAGVSFYGAFLESVVDGNTITQVEKGLVNWSLAKDTAGLSATVVQPNYFNLFTGNTVTHALQGLLGAFINTESSAPLQDRAVIGTLWRNNAISQITGYSIGAGSGHTNAWTEMNLFENNNFSGGLYGVTGLSRARSLILLDNAFAGTGIGDGIEYFSTNTPLLRENSWSNFATNYGGVPPGGLLQLPVHSVELSDNLTNAVVDVWNSGTSNLNWSASTTNSWITISQGSGAVMDEKDGDLLEFHIDPVTIPAGISNGTITVIGNSQTNYVGVEFND